LREITYTTNPAEVQARRAAARTRAGKDEDALWDEYYDAAAALALTHDPAEHEADEIWYRTGRAEYAAIVATDEWSSQKYLDAKAAHDLAYGRWQRRQWIDRNTVELNGVKIAVVRRSMPRRVRS
jgi:hypothetical protein